MQEHANAAERCFVYTPVRLESGDLLTLDGASGFKLQSETQALWITTEAQDRDVFVFPDESFCVGDHRHVVISADAATAMTIAGEANRATRIELIRRDAQRVSVYPGKAATHSPSEPALVGDLAMRLATRWIPALAAVARLIGSRG